MKFNRRNQLEGETAEQYITVLYGLLETCDYGDMADQMLHDRIVVGIRDVALSEHLVLEADLTLEKVKRAVKQKEAVKQHSRQLQEGTRNDPIVVEEVKSTKSHASGSRPKGEAKWNTLKGRGPQSPAGGARNFGTRQLCIQCTLWLGPPPRR